MSGIRRLFIISTLSLFFRDERCFFLRRLWCERIICVLFSLITGKFFRLILILVCGFLIVVFFSLVFFFISFRCIFVLRVICDVDCDIVDEVTWLMVIVVVLGIVVLLIRLRFLTVCLRFFMVIYFFFSGDG